MLTKKQISHILSLREARNRKAEQMYIAEGPKIVDELLEGAAEIGSIFATDAWMAQHENYILAGKANFFRISESELHKISRLTSPNQVLAIVNIPKMQIDEKMSDQDLCLALDGIQDPGNLGTIIRIADWFGIRQIVCSPDTVDLYNHKVVQSTMGSVCRVKVFYRDLGPYLSSLPDDIVVYGAMLEGRYPSNRKVNTRAIILIGNESRGISPSLYPYIDERVRIPSYPTGGGKFECAESLNASVASAILCYEFRRYHWAGNLADTP